MAQTQTTEYFDEGYTTLEVLLQKAQSQGARRVGVVEAGWQESPLGPVYQATAEVETADGRVCRRMGRARPGDARSRTAGSGDPTTRSSAGRGAGCALGIRTAYPTGEADRRSRRNINRVQRWCGPRRPRFHLTRDDWRAWLTAGTGSSR